MKSLLNGLLAGYENYRSSFASFYSTISNAMIQMNDARRCLSSAGEVRKNAHGSHAGPFRTTGYTLPISRKPEISAALRTMTTKCLIGFVALMFCKNQFTFMNL